MKKESRGKRTDARNKDRRLVIGRVTTEVRVYYVLYVMIQVHNTIHISILSRLCRVSQSSWYCTVPTRHQHWYGAWVGTMIGWDQKLKFIQNISVTAENF